MIFCCVCEEEIVQEPPGVFRCVGCDEIGFALDSIGHPDPDGNDWACVITPRPVAPEARA